MALPMSLRRLGAAMPDHNAAWYKGRGLDLSLRDYQIQALERAFRLDAEGKTGDGLVEETKRQARIGIDSGEWSPEKWAKADGWFARHNSDFPDGFDTEDPGPGEVSWLFWGDSGKGQGPKEASSLTEPCGRRRAYEVHEAIKRLDADARREAARAVPLGRSRLVAQHIGVGPWAMERGALSGLVGMMTTGWDGLDAVMEQVGGAHRVEARLRSPSAVVDDGDAYFSPTYDPHMRASGVGVLPVRTALFPRAFGPFQGIDSVVASGWALIEMGAKALVIPGDCPGGACSGMWALHQAVEAWASLVPVFGVTDHQMCSLGEVIFSSCSASYVTRDSTRGSVGVVRSFHDISKMLAMAGVEVHDFKRGVYKDAGSSETPRNERDDEVIQEGVDYYYDMFVDIVARGRGLPPEQVRAMEARVYHGLKAVDEGLADGEMSLGGLLAYLER